METTKNDVLEVDAFGSTPEPAAFSALWRGDFAALRVRNLFSRAACQYVVGRLLAEADIIDHADVEGLRVIGPSHFQAVRNTDVRRQYFADSPLMAGKLRGIAQPHASPFDSALGFLVGCWPPGCQLMVLPSEGRLTPFTVRIYNSGVGIDPHQDILAVESPGDSTAESITQQFGANIYLSVGIAGGALELFNNDNSAPEFEDLSRGPHVISRTSLPPPIMIAPSLGDLIIFPSRRIHAVSPVVGDALRLTISFFIGVTSEESPLRVWA